MIFLSLQQSKDIEYTGVTAISKAIDSPKHFTAKILQLLSKANLIDSRPGPNGGFYLPKGKEVSLTEIVRVIDGNQLFEGCVLGFQECSEKHPCPAHFKFIKVRNQIHKALNTTNIEEMKRVVENEHGYLKL